jgi:acetolactate synthase-1/2/3 large subunit
VLNRRRLDVTVIVFNDASLTLIKLKQREAQGGAAAVGYSPISFAGIATAMGIDSATVRDGDEFRVALAQSEGRPFLIDAAINATDYKDIMKLARG